MDIERKRIGRWWIKIFHSRRTISILHWIWKFCYCKANAIFMFSDVKLSGKYGYENMKNEDSTKSSS